MAPGETDTVGATQDGACIHQSSWPASANDAFTQSAPMKALFRWITTPPQAYVIYALLIATVGGVSFLVGTLKPKATYGVVPTSLSQPRQ